MVEAAFPKTREFEYEYELPFEAKYFSYMSLHVIRWSNAAAKG